MRYFVTVDEEGPTAIDVGKRQEFELGDALVHACRLLDENTRNVTIRDDRNNSISGDDLVACCKGDKEITADLKAIPSEDAGKADRSLAGRT
jgi:hypothetical protein